MFSPGPGSAAVSMFPQEVGESSPSEPRIHAGQLLEDRLIDQLLDEMIDKSEPPTFLWSRVKDPSCPQSLLHQIFWIIAVLGILSGGDLRKEVKRFEI